MAVKQDREYGSREVEGGGKGVTRVGIEGSKTGRGGMQMEGGEASRQTVSGLRKKDWVG